MVYVDGAKVDTFKANKYFLGISITPGEHIVELRYVNPDIKYGVVVSIIGILGLVSVRYLRKKKVC